MITFGPVPSRRLGRSLGINNIPPKRCTYSCVYCQLGRTRNFVLQRDSFYDPKEVFREVRDKLKKLQSKGEKVDYLTFVPDGEPTLDSHLGQEIQLLQPLGKKIAVITNGSLLWREDVRQDLNNSSWVSLKIDSIRKDCWKKIDRPHGKLDFEKILNGEVEFARSYKGELVTETMLVKGINDNQEHMEEIAEFIAGLNPSVAYLAVPTRPPAEQWVQTPDEAFINLAYHVLSQKLKKVELLIKYEGDEFAGIGDFKSDLMSIASVHPLRKEAIEKILRQNQLNWSAMEDLIVGGLLKEIKYQGNVYYLRSFK
ncbi:MAG TPA: radical SAM protein [Anaerolineae bacterium]|nr:radical SAM protein [Anaerolineae bacterium]